MTLAQARALNRYWIDHPPVAVVLNAIGKSAFGLEFKSADPSASAIDDNESLEDVMSQLKQYTR